jgi:peptide deformylase
MKDLEIRTKFISGTQFHYSIYPLVSKDHPALATPTPEFDFKNPPVDPSFLAISLLETMSYNWGVGLAAPQIGLSHRVFAMGSGTSGYACFNPEIVKVEGEDHFEEGCLTYKGLYLDIVRPAVVEARYQDMTGKLHQVTFDGLTARTFLHELDHLNGIVYTSLVKPYFLDRAKAKVKANIKKLEKQRQHQLKQIAIQEAMKKVIEMKKVEQLNKELTISIPDITIDTTT